MTSLSPAFSTMRDSKYPEKPQAKLNLFSCVLLCVPLQCGRSDEWRTLVSTENGVTGAVNQPVWFRGLQSHPL